MINKRLKNKRMGVFGDSDPKEAWRVIIKKAMPYIKNSNCNIVILCGGQVAELEVLKEFIDIKEIEHRIVYNELMIGLLNEFKRDNPNIKVIGGDAKEMVEKNTSVIKDAVVLMNPPYLKTFWKTLLTTVVDYEPKLILTINPDPTEKVNNDGIDWREKCINWGIKHREDVTSYFDVSSGKIGAFVFDFEEPDIDQIKPENPEVTELMNAILVDPKKVDAYSEIDAFQGHSKVAGWSGNIFETKPEPDDEFKHPALLGVSQNELTVEYSKQHFKHGMSSRVWAITRFFGKNLEDPVWEYNNIEDASISANVIVVSPRETDTMEEFIKVYQSKTYRIALSVFRNGGFDIKPKDFKRLRSLNLSEGSNWTEEKIQAILGISHLADFIEKYEIK
jgi:hypothetical protein